MKGDLSLCKATVQPICNYFAASFAKYKNEQISCRRGKKGISYPPVIIFLYTPWELDIFFNSLQTVSLKETLSAKQSKFLLLTHFPRNFTHRFSAQGLQFRAHQFLAWSVRSTVNLISPHQIHNQLLGLNIEIHLYYSPVSFLACLVFLSSVSKWRVGP